MKKIKQLIKLVLGRPSKKVIKKRVTGVNNSIIIDPSTNYGTLNIRMLGNNNSLSIGKNCQLYGENWIFMSGDNNVVSIGDHVTFDNNVHFVLAEGTQIKVGDDCMFAKNITIRTSDQHAIYNQDRQRINVAKNVTIGNHVWVCASVLIMKGTQIADGAVIGINSMVTKDIPRQSVAVGQPARVIKENVYWTREL